MLHVILILEEWPLYKSSFSQYQYFMNDCVLIKAAFLHRRQGGSWSLYAHSHQALLWAPQRSACFSGAKQNKSHGGSVWDVSLAVIYFASTADSHGRGSVLPSCHRNINRSVARSCCVDERMEHNNKCTMLKREPHRVMTINSAGHNMVKLIISSVTFIKSRISQSLKRNHNMQMCHIPKKSIHV